MDYRLIMFGFLIYHEIHALNPFNSKKCVRFNKGIKELLNCITFS